MDAEKETTESLETKTETQETKSLDASTLFNAEETAETTDTETPDSVKGAGTSTSETTSETDKKVEKDASETTETTPEESHFVYKAKDGKERKVTPKDWEETQSTIGKLNTELGNLRGSAATSQQQNQEQVKVILEAFKHLVGDEKFTELEALTKLDKAVIAKLPAELQVPLLQVIEKQDAVRIKQKEQYEESLQRFGAVVDSEWKEMTGEKKELYPGAEEAEMQMYPLIRMGLTPKQAYAALFGTEAVGRALEEQKTKHEKEMQDKIKEAVDKAILEQTEAIRNRRETIHIAEPAGGKPLDKSSVAADTKQTPKQGLIRGISKWISGQPS